MALAGIGALVAMAITMALNYALQRDFAREWSKSFRVKGPCPLGEDELTPLARTREVNAAADGGAHCGAAGLGAAPQCAGWR
jgi:hypothetical protein